MKIIDEAGYQDGVRQGAVERKKLGRRTRPASSDPYLDALKQVRDGMAALVAAVKDSAPVRESVGHGELLAALNRIAAQLAALSEKPKRKKARWKHVVHRNKDQTIQSVESVEE